MSAELTGLGDTQSTPERRRSRWRLHRDDILIAAAGVALFAAVPLLPNFHVTLLNTIGLAALVVIGIVLLTGAAGMTSFGQAAFVGLGAYSAALVATATGLPPWLAWAGGAPWAGLVFGLGLTFVVAMALGAVTLRLSSHYLPLGTIAWGLALYYLFGTSKTLGGHTGLSGVPPLRIGPLPLERSGQIVYLVWGAVLLSLWLARNLLDSRTGRAIRALDGGQAMAASMGVDLYRTKRLVFLLAALLAGLSGWLYAYTNRFVSPAPFSLHAGIDYLFMALIGGVGHLPGAVVGAAVFVLAKDALQDWLPGLLGQAGNFETIVFGTLIVILIQFSPGGIVGWASRLWPRGAPDDISDWRSVPALPRRPFPARGSEVLRVTGLTRRYGGFCANRDVDLTVHAGEILAIIGPNGAGKSTLFNQISCCDRPDGGDIRLLGRSVAGWPASRVARGGLTRTFQHVKLLPGMTVLDNVAIGAHLRAGNGFLRSALRLDLRQERQLRAEARRQLERVGLAEHAHVPAGNLSLGQQRLLEIARALAGDPCLLLLDEAAAGLRHAEKQELAALLRHLRGEGMTILIVEHDMDFVMNLVDRVVVMASGEKIAEGTPHQVRTDARVVEAYLGAEA